MYMVMEYAGEGCNLKNFIKNRIKQENDDIVQSYNLITEDEIKLVMR